MPVPRRPDSPGDQLPPTKTRKPTDERPDREAYLDACLDTLRVMGTHWGQQFEPRRLDLADCAEAECRHGHLPHDPRPSCSCWA